MRTEKQKNTSDNEKIHIENEHIFRKTFGEKVLKVFNTDNQTNYSSKEKIKEYKQEIKKERATLESLCNSGRRNYEKRTKKQDQDYIFLRALDENPNISKFIESLINFNDNRSLIEQLQEKNEDGTPKISDEALGNILELYQTVIKQEQEKLERQVNLLQPIYEANLVKKVESGKLPTQLLDNLKEVKQRNNGRIFESVRIFDARPVDNIDDRSPGEFDGKTSYTKKINIRDGKYSDVLYEMIFLGIDDTKYAKPQEAKISHYFTRLIAGEEASTKLFERENAIEMFRNSMTEAVSQMIMDESPESSKSSLKDYLRNGVGEYSTEREILARLIDIDSRIPRDESSHESLEKLCLEAFVEKHGNKKVKQLRNRLSYIFKNWKNLVRKGDFPEANLNTFKNDEGTLEDIYGHIEISMKGKDFNL